MESRNLIFIVILFIVIVLVGGYFIFRGGYQAPSKGGAPEQITAPPPEASPAEEVTPPPPGAPVREVTVSGTEFSFNPASITVSIGERGKVNFKNEGAAPHNFTIAELGVSTETIGGGQTDTIEFTVPSSGTLTFFCAVSGHRKRGMEGNLNVQ